MVPFRPVGAAEFAQIEESGFITFPPRLPDQPIFYPVLSEAYACEIAGRWNTRDHMSGRVGYVTRFVVDDDYVSSFLVQTVGEHYHQELWIPAEELAIFNQHIVGRIEVLYVFDGRD